MAGTWGQLHPRVWGQPHLGTSGWLGYRDSWDTGTVAPQAVGTATFGDIGVTGTQGQPRLGTPGQPYSGMLCVGTAGDITSPSSLCPQASRWLSARPRSPRPPSPPPTMNVLAPVRRDRVIADLPPCFRKEAALHARPAFHPTVASACQEERTGTASRWLSARPRSPRPPSPPPTMNVLAPVRRDRVIADLPPCFRKEAALHARPAFHPTVASACQEERTGTVGWDTAGQERFKCIASTYYRGAQAIVIVFDVNDVASLEHTRQWLADALKENDPSNVILFLVGSKKDLSTPAQYSLMEKDALKVAQEMQAEYWAVSSLTGENVRDFFFRVAALTFESSVLAELERSSARKIGDTVRISSNESDLYLSAPRKKPKCCQ
ncbi:PREDICTED: ras-related protein Rab-34 [Calidris pugnax]|uniref:ras-related protein Rab-34 n=1 Tax=Calidris pugnax TaxID=198806 RepID=UPI00071C3B2C|nr:PREDICTED: ras-related protein Rab-34 [Calidris pugnax]